VYLIYFYIFGCHMYVHHTDDDKLEARAYKGILMRYTNGIKGYRIWNPVDLKIVYSKNVTFDESAMFNSKEKLPTTLEEYNRPKEMEEVPVFQPGSRVVVDFVEEGAVDIISQDSP